MSSEVKRWVHSTFQVDQHRRIDAALWVSANCAKAHSHRLSRDVTQRHPRDRLGTANRDCREIVAAGARGRLSGAAVGK
jgi:hypothetical protein